MARDRRFPILTHQVLMSPMLDDRLITASSQELDGEGMWDRNDNLFGWTALLGDRRGGPDVSMYTAPARETDLSGLPRTYLDCGSAQTFRDETIDYAHGSLRQEFPSTCTSGVAVSMDSISCPRRGNYESRPPRTKPVPPTAW
jgi:acetyl esterase/lipase